MYHSHIGIFLFRKLKDITDWKKEDYFRRDEDKSEKEPPETYVVQRYITCICIYLQLSRLLYMHIKFKFSSFSIGILTIPT